VFDQSGQAVGGGGGGADCPSGVVSAAASASLADLHARALRSLLRGAVEGRSVCVMAHGARSEETTR
jgi:hypothetical protein